MQNSCNYTAFRYSVIKLTAHYKMARGVRIYSWAEWEGGWSLVCSLCCLHKASLCLGVQQGVTAAFFSGKQRGGQEDTCVQVPRPKASSMGSRRNLLGHVPPTSESGRISVAVQIIFQILGSVRTEYSDQDSGILVFRGLILVLWNFEQEPVSSVGKLKLNQALVEVST